MSSIMSLMQTAMNTTTNLHNAGSVLKSEIELDRIRGVDVTKKENQLEELKTRETKSYDYFAQAAEDAEKQAGTLLESAEDINKAKETDKATEKDEAKEADKAEDAGKAEEQAERTDATAATADNAATTSKAAAGGNAAKAVVSREPGQIVDISV